VDYLTKLTHDQFDINRDPMYWSTLICIFMVNTVFVWQIFLDSFFARATSQINVVTYRLSRYLDVYYWFYCRTKPQSQTRYNDPSARIELTTRWNLIRRFVVNPQMVPCILACVWSVLWMTIPYLYDLEGQWKSIMMLICAFMALLTAFIVRCKWPEPYFIDAPSAKPDATKNDPMDDAKKKDSKDDAKNTDNDAFRIAYALGEPITAETELQNIESDFEESWCCICNHGKPRNESLRVASDASKRTSRVYGGRQCILDEFNDDNDNTDEVYQIIPPLPPSQPQANSTAVDIEITSGPK